MCKHVAAVLHGVGSRLDHQPELLFTLRNVDSQELIAKAGSDLSKKRKGPAGVKVLVSDDLSEMFGIEMAPAPPPSRVAVSAVATKPSTAALPIVVTSHRRDEGLARGSSSLRPNHRAAPEATGRAAADVIPGLATGLA